MINPIGSPQIASGTPTTPRAEAESGPRDTFRFEPPKAGFEPWLGGGPERPPAQGKVPGGPVPEPIMTIEPWLRGAPTTDPNVGPRFADKLTRAFGEQAILSLEDDRIHGVGGYYLKGWESVGFVEDIALGRLGDRWEVTGHGTFELKAPGVRQELSFDMSTGQTRLESAYEEQSYDTTLVREVLTLDGDGLMRRDHPPIGL